MDVFKFDRLARDVSGRPIGSIVLVGDYVVGNLLVAVLSVPGGTIKGVKNTIFYLDGKKYRVDPKISDIRFTQSIGKVFVNNFTLEMIDG